MLRKLIIRQRKLAEYLLILAGTAIMAVSLQLFLDPDGLVPGGFTGIAIIVKELTRGLVPDGIPLWVTNLLLNIPMIPIVLKIKGWDFAKRTLAGSLLLSFWLYRDSLCAADGRARSVFNSCFWRCDHGNWCCTLYF